MPDGHLQSCYTILIVDDDDAFRRSQQRLLARTRLAGTNTTFEILEAPSGTAALERLRQHPVNCVLLDYRMPGGDGTEWLPRILKAYPDVAVIMVTGGGSEQIAAQAMREGAMDYLVKGDISLSTLERALLNAFEKVELRKTIHAQREELIKAEQHRAMVASLAAARHHLGQPITAITLGLELMKRNQTNPEMCQMVAECIAAVEDVANILTRLDQVTEFRTEPYLHSHAATASALHNVILKI